MAPKTNSTGTFIAQMYCSMEDEKKLGMVSVIWTNSVSLMMFLWEFFIWVAALI